MFRALLDCEECQKRYWKWIAETNKARAVITAVNRKGKHPFDHMKEEKK